MIRTPRRARRGANAIEFALILPVLLLFLLGIFESSWAFNRFLLISSAAQQASRFAAMAGEDDDPQAMAQQRAEEALASQTFSAIDVTATLTGASPNRTLTVEITVPHPSLTSYIPGFPDELRARSVRRMEEQP